MNHGEKCTVREIWRIYRKMEIFNIAVGVIIKLKFMDSVWSWKK